MEDDDMDSQVVERSIWIEAPRAKVWKAITDPTEIAPWFIPAMPWATMSRTDNGTLMIHIGEMGMDFAVLEIGEDGKTATMRSLPDKLRPVTYSLNDHEGGTRVTVRVSGFSAPSDGDSSDRQRLTGESWDKTLGNLKAHIDGTDAPHPDALVGPLFGFWREVRKRHAIERSIWIDAKREKVWRAITDPKQLQAWFSPMTEWNLTNLDVGGRFYVNDAEAGREKYVEVIEQIEPPSLLVTRALPEPEETSEAVKRYTLAEEDGGTRLTLLYIDHAPEWTDERRAFMEQTVFGFGSMLLNVKAYMEGRELPFPYGF
jgi:uncharacterized protein YndB with AHSA1/START domain